MTTPMVGTGARGTYGTILLLLSASSVLPGVGMVTAPFVGLASLLLGIQLTTGRSTPWLPAWLRSRIEASDLGPRFGHWLHQRCRPLLQMALPSFPLPLAGLTVAWSSLILILPLAIIPFSNTIPSLSVGLIGAGLLTGRSLFGWLGMALSGGYTVALVLLAEVLILALQAVLRFFT